MEVNLNATETSFPALVRCLIFRTPGVPARNSSGITMDQTLRTYARDIASTESNIGHRWIKPLELPQDDCGLQLTSMCSGYSWPERRPSARRVRTRTAQPCRWEGCPSASRTGTSGLVVATCTSRPSAFNFRTMSLSASCTQPCRCGRCLKLQ